MDAYKENIISSDQYFPVDVFISDNLQEKIHASLHYHDCVEILYIMKGTARQRVNDQYYNTNQNDIIILKPCDIHTTDCNKNEDTKILVIKFLPQIINMDIANSFESKYIMNFLNKEQLMICHITDTLKNSQDIYNLMHGIYREFTSKETGYEIFLKGYIYQLIAYLLRSGFISSSYQNLSMEKQLKILDPLLKYIENNYKEVINLKVAAKLLNLSYFYLSRYFKKVTGQNFKEYIDFIRVCEAEKLLLSQNITITQVAYDVGFSNVSAFCRVFKRVKKYSPGSIKRAKTV
jgi:AraC-like DNA-binding protein